MSALLTRRLEFLARDGNRALLAQGLRGIEREALRVDAQGRLATTPHPRRLGAALTHPHLTTDFSEALLEIITPPEHDTAAMLARLDALHRFVRERLGDEMLWCHSMPCRLPQEEGIPIAWYGTSHEGMLKHVYRRGLALRYGKAMQCIAGLHYNFSVAEALWRRLKDEEGAPGSAMHHQSEMYISLIRNFRRYGWLLMYLFGASPALAQDFQGRRGFALETFSQDSLYLPYATSLRMSDMGYQNDAQSGLTPDYNNLDSYIGSLVEAMNQPYMSYEALGTKRNGEWIQLNTNRLQIENEYYSVIRPKRITWVGERPLQALARRGVQYIEVRCLDIDPFEPLGIGLQACRFLDAFLLFCALEESPPTELGECRENRENFALTVKEGRRPGLLLQRDGARVSLRGWALEILQRVEEVCHLLDAQRDDGAHAEALAAQTEKVLDVEQTPSARVLAAMKEEGGSFFRFALRRSLAHAEHFAARPVSPAHAEAFERQVQDSLAELELAERAQSGAFDDFVSQFQAGASHQARIEAAESAFLPGMA
ncbi:MAG: glutamate--cysteine ligase [Pseudomonadota bacterium]